VFDACGVCGGDGYSCAGCDGVPNSGKVDDVCGVCGGDGSSCEGCDGVPNSGKVDDTSGGADWWRENNTPDGCPPGCLPSEKDNCGICHGDNSSCTGCTDATAKNYDIKNKFIYPSTSHENACDYDGWTRTVESCQGSLFDNVSQKNNYNTMDLEQCKQNCINWNNATDNAESSYYGMDKCNAIQFNLSADYSESGLYNCELFKDYGNVEHEFIPNPDNPNTDPYNTDQY
jgi:hypothetical protein